MRTSRFTDEQIVGILTERAAADASAPCRWHGISEQTLYRWKRKYDGLAGNDVKRLKTLEEENASLKRIVAEQAFDNQALRALLRKNIGRPPCAGRRRAWCDDASPSRSGAHARWWGLAGRRCGAKVGRGRTMGRCGGACSRWPASARASGTGDCAPCCGGRGSRSTTSGSNGSTARTGWRCAGGGGSAWRGPAGGGPSRRAARTSSGRSTSWATRSRPATGCGSWRSSTPTRARRWRSRSTRACQRSEWCACWSGSRQHGGCPSRSCSTTGRNSPGARWTSGRIAAGCARASSTPGEPIQNAFCESFNGRFRDGCLNEHWFLDLADVRRLIVAWRVDNKHHRPQSSLAYRTTAASAQDHDAVERLPNRAGLS